jgi:UDP:flavonoid glycosyltransferase YjiC (YdhE family)
VRVLFTAWAWPTHFYPMVPLAWAFRAAGHEVRVAGQPALMPVVRRCGLPGMPVGADTESPSVIMAAVRRREDPGSDGGSALVAPRRRRLAVSVHLAEAMVGGVLDSVRQWRPDLIVYEPTTYAGPLVSAVTGVPALRHLWGVDVHHAAREHEAAAFAPLCRRLGVAGLPGAVPTLDPCPPALQLGGGGVRVPMRYVPYNGPGTMPRWLAGPPARRRICLTGGLSLSWRPGSSPAGDPASGGLPLTELVRALRGVDAEIVVAVSPADRSALSAALGPAPDHVRVVEMLPLHLLLDSCDLVVSRGGNGTLMTAVTAGTPQLCIPGQRADWASAESLAATGAGEFCDPATATGEDIRRAAERILAGPGYREAARRLRDQANDRPPPARAVADIEALVGAGRR